MGFKTDLQSNNTDLQTILDAINELPEAGEGGSGGTDTSGDTVTPETLVTGYTAHDASGEPITGVNPYELESTNATVEEQADLIAQIEEALATKAAYNTVYIGTTEPTADFGENGDIYIVRSE